MPVLQFKGKTAVECYHYTVPHHTLDFDRKLAAFRRVPYPVQETQAEMREAGLPSLLAERLARGE